MKSKYSVVYMAHLLTSHGCVYVFVRVPSACASQNVFLHLSLYSKQRRALLTQLGVRGAVGTPNPNNVQVTLSAAHGCL